MSYSEGIGNRLNRLGFICCLILSTVAQAEMKPISDEELSQYSGQAAVAFDVTQLDTTSYTRVTLGMEADLQMNINHLEAGRFNRAGETTLEADLSIKNLAFGSISTNDAQVQLDGQTYAVNDIIPFELNDPYFEIAQNASEELTGFRLGFGEARGVLSGDIESFSGNIGVDITDYFGDEYRSEFLDENGSIDSVRSSKFGVSKEVTGGATNCNTGFYCYDLADYKSFDVGDRNSVTGEVDYTKDFFISFQKEDTQWSTSDGSINTGMGVFMNIPTSLHIDMNTGANAAGVARVRTEYIDRGNDLF
jgi:hypothetical protein